MTEPNWSKLACLLAWQLSVDRDRPKRGIKEIDQQGVYVVFGQDYDFPKVSQQLNDAGITRLAVGDSLLSRDTFTILVRADDPQTLEMVQKAVAAD
jgi:hypothetical protein